MLKNAEPIVAGIDVGGARKGFHVAILQGKVVRASIKEGDPQRILQCLRDEKVTAVGIDSPCKWALPGNKSRLAERQMRKERIWSFSTPNKSKVEAHTKWFYEWMKNGWCLYEVLAAEYPLLEFADGTFPEKFAFETFPHAITCAFLGVKNTSAEQKREQRGELLGKIGIELKKGSTSIDDMDAALCAVTALHLLDGPEEFKSYGDRAEGYIFVPQRSAVA